MMINIPEETTNTFEDIYTQINIQKQTFESTSKSGTKPMPMVVFYIDSSSPYLSVVSPYGTTFEDTVKNITTALHLYSSIGASGCYVTLSSQYIIDDLTYPALNIFVMNRKNAYTITLPYKEEDNDFTWFDDHSIISQIDDQDLDDLGRNIISSFYLFVNSDGLPFKTEEILSYMSTQGHQVMFHDESSVPKYLSISDPF